MESKKCKLTSKTRYPTPGEAKQALNRLRATVRHYDHITGKRVNRRSGKVQQCRFYHCVHCNGYHMTSHSAPLKQKKRELLFVKRIKQTSNLVLDEEQSKEWKKDSLPFPNLNNNNNEMV